MESEDYLECVNHDKFYEIEELKRKRRFENKNVIYYPVYNQKQDRFEDVFGNPIKDDPTQKTN